MNTIRGCTYYLLMHEGVLASSLKPGQQLPQMLLPWLVHSAPVTAKPFSHEHTLGSHWDLSALTLQPVLQADTRHADSYCSAFCTLQSAHMQSNEVRLCVFKAGTIAHTGGVTVVFTRQAVAQAY